MRKIQMAVYGAAAILMGILPKVFVCPKGNGVDIMRCWQSAAAEGWVALGFLLTGIVLVFLKSEKAGAGANLAAIAVSVAGILIPLKWIGGCMSPLMPCHTLGFPIVYGICTITFFTAVIGLTVQLSKCAQTSLNAVCRRAE